MAIVREQGGGRRGQLGGGRTSRTLRYRATGYNTISAAENAVIAQITSDLGGLTLDGVPLAGLSVEETAVDNHYIATARFDPLPPLAPQTTEDPSRFTFDFSQETIRAQVALSTTFFGDDIPERGNLINVKKNQNGSHRVEGVDVPSPALTFGKTVILPAEEVTDSFVNDLKEIHLHTNNGVFAGQAIGEVLFVGASGSQRSESEVELTYRFASKANIVDETIGGIEHVTKLGWQYLEPIYDDQVIPETNTTSINFEAKLIGFAVHTLFPSGDLSSLPGL